MTSTIHVLIKGKVQGVFFRASAKEFARQMGLKGWIKNTDKGYVEAMVSGNTEPVAKFVEWCKSGPPKAEVEEVIVNERDFVNFNTFEVIK